jgi:hypothetical protein
MRGREKINKHKYTTSWIASSRINLCIAAKEVAQGCEVQRESP